VEEEKQKIFETACEKWWTTSKGCLTEKLMDDTLRAAYIGKDPENKNTSRLILIKKKDKECKQFLDLRPIMIGALGVRLLEKMASIYLEKLTEDDYDELVGQHQLGFRPRESCHGNILKLWRNATKKVLDNPSRRQSIVFVDFASSYDSIHRWRIEEVIDQLTNRLRFRTEGESDQVMGIIKHLYLNAKFMTLINATDTKKAIGELTNIERGVPQGGV
jgi:hypothetical protein